jgi:hypothetical protein
MWRKLLTGILSLWDGKQHVMSSPAKLDMLHSTVIIFFINGSGRPLIHHSTECEIGKDQIFHFLYILAVLKSICVCTLLLNTAVSGRDGKKLNAILMIEFATEKSKLSV